MDLKQTPLYKEHIKAGAKMIDFSGWTMPVQYESIIKEHENTRNNVSVFDTSHMGEFFITGDDTFNFLQNVLTADLKKVSIDQAKYCFLLNKQAGIIDDLISFYIADNYYMLCVNSGTREKDFAWLTQYAASYNVDIIDVSNKTAKIDVQGPLSEKVMKKLTDDELPSRFRFINTRIKDITVILSRTGYTGEDGFELFFEADLALEMWHYIFEAGNEFNIKPAGLGARDSLRLEACYPLYGNELSEEINPFIAGLDFAVNLDKKEDFIGKQSLINVKKAGIDEELVALQFVDKGIPRQGYEVFHQGAKIGYISSGTFSPTFKKGIALAYINKKYNEINKEVEVKIRNKFHKAIIMKKPLYSFKGEK